jgi:hypothetical protein
VRSLHKYAYIDDKKIYPVIISSKLSRKEEESLLEILRKHRGAMGYTLDDLKGISPTICHHAINMEPDAKLVVELLDAGIIYPIADSIADSRWVSRVHC